MKLNVIKAFDWAHRGVQIEHFEVGQEIETEDEDLIDVAIREGWAEDESGEKKATPRAPQRQAAKGAPETK